jgi:hypothetical protein
MGAQIMPAAAQDKKAPEYELLVNHVIETAGATQDLRKMLANIVGSLTGENPQEPPSEKAETRAGGVFGEIHYQCQNIERDTAACIVLLGKL